MSKKFLLVVVVLSLVAVAMGQVVSEPPKFLLGTAEAGVIAVAVTAIVQLAKKAGVPAKFAWPMIFLFSLAGEIIYCVSQPVLPTRLDAMSLFIAYGMICTAASGVFELAATAVPGLKQE